MTCIPRGWTLRSANALIVKVFLYVFLCPHPSVSCTSQSYWKISLKMFGSQLLIINSMIYTSLFSFSLKFYLIFWLIPTMSICFCYFREHVMKVTYEGKHLNIVAFYPELEVSLSCGDNYRFVREFNRRNEAYFTIFCLIPKLTIFMWWPSGQKNLLIMWFTH